MTNPVPDAIRLNPSDNVVIALRDLGAGSRVPDVAVPLAGPVARGHKIAARAIAPGETVIRYGQIIGVATRPIAAGEHVHTHNLGMGAHEQDYAHATEVRPLPAPAAPRSFMGFHRADGGVGTRNYLGILTSVNCSGSVARFIAEGVEKAGWLAGFPNVDGVVPIVHGTGTRKGVRPCARYGRLRLLKLRCFKGLISVGASHPGFGAKHRPRCTRSRD